MEMRLVALLLADMSGFTEFSSQADRYAVEAAVRQQQLLILGAIEQFHGRLIKWIGDAALAVFTSTTDAVLCGHQIQQVLIERAERGSAAIGWRVKVVVHAGDVLTDTDGDIYGDAVNFLARMEKAAEPEAVYFSEAVQRLIGPAEIPFEAAGEFDFKGIAGPARLYRTCFGQSPVVRERVVLVQTNFVGLQGLADEAGWDTLHPLLDACTGRMLEAARKHGGTSRGSLQVGSFFTFPALVSCLRAVRDWHGALARLDAGPLSGRLGLRVGLHHGTLHIMKHTMMGRDIDLVRTLSALATGDEILLTDAAVAAAAAEGVPAAVFQPFTAAEMRDCGSKRRWLSRYAETAAFALPAAEVPLSILDQAGAN
jgi:class 3 adenylate cyclase